MFQSNFAQEPKVDNLDADAVCSRCNTVNDVGVLICKNCGNNLRDQRHERLGEEHLLVGEEKGRKRKFLIRALGVFGILVVIWVGLNASSIAEWAVRVGTGAVPDGRIFWQGEDAPTFDALRAEVEAISPTNTQIQESLESRVLSMDYTGPYFLLKNNEIIGYAYAHVVNNYLYVDALTNNGVEIRGKLSQDGFTLSLEKGNAAFRTEFGFSTLDGQVYQDEEGAIVVGGRDTYTERVFTCKAYRLRLQ